jgi:hypothetical protein
LCYFSGAGEVPISTKIILSSHNFKETPPAAELHARAAAMREAGADIVKIATMANDISDAATVLSLLQQKTGAPYVTYTQDLNGVFVTAQEQPPPAPSHVVMGLPAGMGCVLGSQAVL